VSVSVTTQNGKAYVSRAGTPGKVILACKTSLFFFWQKGILGNPRAGHQQQHRRMMPRRMLGEQEDIPAEAPFFF